LLPKVTKKGPKKEKSPAKEFRIGERNRKAQKKRSYTIGPVVTTKPSEARCKQLLITLLGADGFDHVVADAAQLADGDVFQSLTAFVELLVDLDGRLLHDGVGFLASAHEDKVFASR
jgi:hypothetical protein